MEHYNHLNRRFLTSCVLLLFALSSLCGNVRLRTLNTISDVERRQLVALYNNLQKLPTRKLMAMGMKSFDSGAVADSAVVCFAVVGNRYNDDMSLAEKTECVDAIISDAHISSSQYYDYKRSYERLSKAIAIIEKDDRLNSFLPRLYINAGNLFMNCGEHYGSKSLVDTASDYMYKAFDEAAQYENWEYYIKSYLHLTAFLVRLNKFTELKELLDSRNFSIVPDSAGNYKAFQLWYYGMLSLDNGKYDDARKLFREESTSVNDTHVPQRYRALAVMTIAHTFEMENRLDSAIAVYRRLLPEIRQAGMIDMVGNVYSFLYNAYKRKGDNSEYLEFYEKYIHLKDSLMTKSGMAEVGETHFQNLLKQESDNAERLRERNMNYFILALVLAVSLVAITVILLLVSRKNKYLKERNRLLFERAQSVVEAEQAGDDVADQQKYRSSTLSDDMKIRLVGDIKKLMADPETVCQPNLSLDQVAKILGVNSRYVSQTINECFGMNFSMLLAKSRVREACLRLGSADEYANLTIEAIAQSVGFRSRNTLITAFKKFTGLTPSEYQRMSQEKTAE